MARRLVAGGMLVVGCFWLAFVFNLISAPRNVALVCQITFYVLWVILLVMDWRNRKRQPHKEPSPAQNALAVIIAILTALLAVIAFRFASKNREAIGEARFNTTRNNS